MITFEGKEKRQENIVKFLKQNGISGLEEAQKSA